MNKRVERGNCRIENNNSRTKYGCPGKMREPPRKQDREDTYRVWSSRVLGVIHYYDWSQIIDCYHEDHWDMGKWTSCSFVYNSRCPCLLVSCPFFNTHIKYPRLQGGFLIPSFRKMCFLFFFQYHLQFWHILPHLIIICIFILLLPLYWKPLAGRAFVLLISESP